MAKHKQVKKRGRKPENLKAKGVNWKDAMSHALGKPKPTEGWGKRGVK